ncbi:hypothetical protein Bca4012_082244 [Brassica carinata]
MDFISFRNQKKIEEKGETVSEAVLALAKREMKRVREEVYAEAQTRGHTVSSRVETLLETKLSSCPAHLL